ncbi:hypothetical protein [Desulfoferrobacter suflitae]|uniref:hypothetical protein n=1 Tax=Desulfoferrobacter suflitae TaxID=2865782 RepID=UPI002164B674|nr:hypothetical protein [Desulfoferrobacter suflitae]MCK8602702.1 hypothetical protein [Desulfoferrobacter suflitae]
MNKLYELWEKFINFLAEYDSQKITEIIRQLNWNEVLYKPLFWVLVVPMFGYLLWKRRFQTLLLIFSLVLFVMLALYTLPPAGQPIPLSKILSFAGGSIALVAVNLYFLFVRS